MHDIKHFVHFIRLMCIFALQCSVYMSGLSIRPKHQVTSDYFAIQSRLQLLFICEISREAPTPSDFSDSPPTPESQQSLCAVRPQHVPTLSWRSILFPRFSKLSVVENGTLKLVSRMRGLHWLCSWRRHEKCTRALQEFEWIVRVRSRTSSYRSRILHATWRRVYRSL